MNQELKQTESTSSELFGPELFSTLKFLAVPAVMVLMLLLLNVQIPKLLLYSIGGVIGAILAFRSMSNPEWLLACFIIYMPFNKEFVIPLAAGLNGTNLFVLLLIVSWFMVSSKENFPKFRKFDDIGRIKWFLILSFTSLFTVMYTIDSDYMMDNILSFKEWVFQFIIFYAVLNLIRDKTVARRIIVYVMIGTVMVFLFGFDQLLERSGYSSIEKSRVPGPQGQPNEFGAFIVYNASFLIAIFLVYFPKKNILFIYPTLALMAKVLLGTFSRGAYLGLAMSFLVGGFIRGKAFLLGMFLLAIMLVAVFPQVVPESISARFSNTQVEGKYGEQKLDKSTGHRLILWQAALDMIVESPLLGKGYRGFHGLKQDYTSSYVHESDTHNLYLYIASCLGVPALILFLLILYKTFRLGYSLYRESNDNFNKMIGLAGTMMVVGIMVVNMFGTRFNDIGTNGYFWVYLAVILHMTRSDKALKSDK
jgi:O-antigen ligase